MCLSFFENAVKKIVIRVPIMQNFPALTGLVVFIRETFFSHFSYGRIGPECVRVGSRAIDYYKVEIVGVYKIEIVCVYKVCIFNSEKQMIELLSSENS